MAPPLTPDDELAAQRHVETHSRYAARSVALIGFMGVGKTTVGRALAGILDRPFLDTDNTVEERTGRTILELFAEGEPVFRRHERAAIEAALAMPPAVMALGGGAFVQPGLADMLLSRALVVHLYTPWRVMIDLLPALAADRPLIRDRQTWQVQQLFLDRAASYRRAHVRISLPRHGAQEAAGMVADVLRCDRAVTLSEVTSDAT
jgi:shikimate kinase